VTPITRAGVSVFTIPTDGPESDGTLEWTSTTIVIVETAAGALCDAHNMPLSSHTASALHVHPCCALGRVRHAA
jgi:hypothetical protein